MKVLSLVGRTAYIGLKNHAIDIIEP
jgi:hypothetical protein